MDWYGDVFKLVFPDVEEGEINKLWKKELAKPPKEEVEKEDGEAEMN